MLCALLLSITGAALATDGKSMNVSELPNISRDKLNEAVTTFIRSCEKYYEAGTKQEVGVGYTDERAPIDKFLINEVCGQIQLSVSKENIDNNHILEVMNRYFYVTELNPEKSENLLTAYYEPTIPFSEKAISGELDWPLYSKPMSLTQGVAWYSRKDIESGVAGSELANNILGYTTRWDAYVLSVQGSGIGERKDGSIINLIYSGKNGHTYKSIGKELIRRGEISQDKISMQSIKAWLDSKPREVQDELYSTNPSYVFFAVGDNNNDLRIGPPGAMDLVNVGLTPYRSVAADWAHHIPGMPLYIQGALGDGESVSRMVIIQDRGGAIKTRTRVDLFLGSGDKAKEVAGRTRDENLKVWSFHLRNFEKQNF